MGKNINNALIRIISERVNNALIRIISERVNMSVGETKQMIVELAELIKEERGGG
jgi:hypothetical protein